MAQERIAILSAAGDVGWRDAAARALRTFVQTRVVLNASSVLDPGYPVLLIWTARASAYAEIAGRLLAGRDDVVLWRPDGAVAPAWLASAYPVGPDMPARALAIMIRFALAETARRLPDPRRAPRRLLPAAAALGAALIGCAALAAQWKAQPVAAAEGAPVADLRGRE